MSNETTLRPGELKDVLLKEIEAADLSALDVQEVGTVLEVKDGVARVYGLMSAMSGEMLEFTSSSRRATKFGARPGCWKFPSGRRWSGAW